MSKRVYVYVSAGVVNQVDVPVETDGTWTVVDWDNIEADPGREWSQFDLDDVQHIRKNYPEDWARYFAQFENTSQKGGNNG
jgi:hypothetical protein